MKFLASLGTKDEAELIRPCVQHLRRIGAELILITDYGSTDATLDIIKEEEARGDIWLFHVSDNADPLRSERERSVARNLSAEWVFFLDTDEFWLPAGGTLRSISALDEHDALLVDPFDVVLTTHFEQHWEDYLLGDEITSLPVFGTGAEQWPKVLVRPEALDTIADGNHAVTLGRERPWRQGRATDVVVAHMPFTTLARFERKIDNIRRFQASNPSWFADGRGAHWLDWLRTADKVGTEVVFANERVNPSRLDELATAGAVTTIADVLRERGHFQHDRPSARPIVSM